MRKIVEPWGVEELRKQFGRIAFPEYQREPNLWSRIEKQRLIDSMVRQFDIASLYLYRHDDGAIDCVDGRQRINSIMSFLGENEDDESDNNFPLMSLNEMNEIYQEEKPEYESLDGMTFGEIRQRSVGSGHAAIEAKTFVEGLLSYELAVVMLSESGAPEEFNLQFTRLNLGTIINSGEKLNAMIGDLRSECFGEGGLGSHPFLEATRIPTRRYAREQVAAQIVAQVMSYVESETYTRTRHFDLQRVFKQNGQLTADRRDLVKRVRSLLDLLDESFGNANILRNRAITVSIVLLAWTTDVKTSAEASRMVAFVGEFQEELDRQVKKGLDADLEFRYLLDFQRHLTQASVEKPAVTERARILGEEFKHWRMSGKLSGVGKRIAQ